MTDSQKIWKRACEDLVDAIVDLGYPEEFGYDIARMLGSPKAMDRMRGYLYGFRPTSAEIIVDEVLAINSEIDAWKRKRAAQEANLGYNEILRNGLGAEDE